MGQAGDEREFRVEIDGPLLANRGGFYGAGDVRCRAPAQTLAEHRYARSAIGAVVSGVFNYLTPRGDAAVAPGAILLGNAKESFACLHLDSAGNRRAVLALDDALMAELAEDLDCAEGRFAVAAVAPGRATAPLYGAIRRLARDPRPQEERVVSVTAAALALGRRVRRRDASRVEHHRVRDVAHEIERRYAEALPLTELAASAGLSRYHFIRAFRDVTGETPRQFQIGVRLKAAADQLLDTKAPITTIALNVGFNDLSYFNHTFRDAFGQSPRAWRNAA
ncbi:AraC family transcriptional regulator [Caulobacter sp. 1776]|uniref:helix-turn-helix transcriptional regulator n=1 Tax=Caulobacter sp. 1776 TaxID=3156420 RepID=UPI00339AC550